MAIGPPDLVAQTIFGSYRTDLPPNLAKCLVLKTYDDLHADTMRLAIYWNRGIDQQRFALDLSHMEWLHDAESCVQRIKGWIAGVLHEVKAAGEPCVPLQPQTATAPKAMAPAKPTPPQGPEPVPTAAPGARHIELE